MMRNIGLTLICFCIYTLSLFGQDAYHTSLVTYFQDNFNLPAGNWLLYDEEAAILENATGYGGSFSTEEFTGTDFSKNLQATITRASANQWDSGWNMRNQKAIKKGDKVTDISIIVDPIITSTDNISKDNGYVILYPNPVDNHIIIKQLEQKKMHVRLLNLGGQVLREQWTEALETDFYVENLKGLFIVEIEYEGGVFSQTVVIQ